MSEQSLKSSLSDARLADHIDEQFAEYDKAIHFCIEMAGIVDLYDNLLVKITSEAIEKVLSEVGCPDIYDLNEFLPRKKPTGFRENTSDIYYRLQCKFSDHIERSLMRDAR